MRKTLCSAAFVKPLLASISCCFLALTSVSCSKTSQDGVEASSENTYTAEEKTKDWEEFSSKPAQTFIQECKSNYLKIRDFVGTLESETYSGNALLEALNTLEADIDKTIGKASLYANVHPEENVRAAADACEQHFVGLISDLSLSQSIYKQIAAIDMNTLPAKIDKRYVSNMLRDFKRSGVDLDEEKRKTVKQLKDEINQLGQAFYKNAREDVRSITVPKGYDLSGLPSDFIESRTNAETGEVTFTTTYPDYFPVMQYAHNDELRKNLYMKFRQRGYPASKEVLKQLLKKRHELATILGYPSYAHYATEVQMIKTPEKALAFINSIDKIAKDRAESEYNTLLAKLRETFPDATFVGDWQKTYLDELIKKEKFDVDSQEVREYFQYEKVKQGIFDLIQTMFNVEIRPWETETWHKSVSAYEVIDQGETIGHFYLDMHPRAGKYQHAAAFSIQGGIAGKQLPVSALVCNFPSGNALMEHTQVETFLHEFGHLIHGMFGGKNKWISHSGTRTERDFVEAPSQMLEEWVWNKETLRLFATNTSGETMPDALIDKLRASRDFGLGLFTRHQMFYAALSLNYYSKDPNKFDEQTLMEALQAKYSNFAYVDNTFFQYSFSHLFGYSAVYYSYMWSLVIADDMFSEFQKSGMLNQAVAQKYRQTVLAPGGSKDAGEMVEDFLGRPYSFDAFSKKFH